jgi:hypothetical protein
VALYQRQTLGELDLILIGMSLAGWAASGDFLAFRLQGNRLRLIMGDAHPNVPKILLQPA